MTASSPAPGPSSGPDPTDRPSDGSSLPAGVRVPGLARSMLLYGLARLALVAVITAVLLVAGVPLAIAVLVGLIVALPLSMVLFRGLRTQLDTALATAGDRRATEREILRARLRGDDGSPTSDQRAQP